MSKLVEEDSRTQRQINWGKGDNGEVECHQIRGMEEVVEEGKGDGGAQGCSREEEEAEWEDVELLGRRGPGKETKGAASTTQDLRKPSPVKYTGRLRGKGVRGYWVGRRTGQIQGRIKSELKGDQEVTNDSKCNGKTRVKGIETRAGAGPETIDHGATTRTESAEEEEH